MENQVEEAPAKSKMPVWLIILIIFLVVFCVLPVCVIVILALLGPAIGNIFSNVILSV